MLAKPGIRNGIQPKFLPCMRKTDLGMSKSSKRAVFGAKIHVGDPIMLWQCLSLCFYCRNILWRISCNDRHHTVHCWQGM